jgi:hypothetical protein
MSVIVAGLVAQTWVVQKMHKSIFVVRSPDQCLSMRSYLTLVRKTAVEKRPHYFVARVSGRSGESSIRAAVNSALVRALPVELVLHILTRAEDVCVPQGWHARARKI